MNKHCARFFPTIKHALFGLATLAFCGVAQAQINISHVREVLRVIAPGESYDVGDIFYIEVELEPGANILSVAGQPPRLRLNPSQTGLLNKNDKRFASYEFFMNRSLYFSYEVQPGDFAADINALQLTIIGSTINTSFGTLTFADANTLPTGVNGLADHSDISIRTIGFVGEANPLAKSVTMQTGDVLPITLTRTQSGGLKVPFTVSTVPANAIPANFTAAPLPFTIAQADGDGTITISAVAATGGPVTLRLHPDEYGVAVTGGDLLVTLDITPGPPPPTKYYTIESAKGAVEEGEIVMITVQLAEPAPAGGLIVTLTNAPAGAINWVGGNGTVVIPAGQTSGSKPAEFQAGFTSVFIGGASGTPNFDMAAGTVVSISSYTPSFRVEGASLALTEGDPVTSSSVILGRAAASSFTITLNNDNPTALAIVGPTVLQFHPGDISRPFQVRPLDGGTTVPLGSIATITGVPSDPGYQDAGSGIFIIENRNPVFTAPVPTIPGQPQAEWILAQGAEGFIYTFSWAGDDVAADRPKLEANVNFGDGNQSGWIPGAAGTTSHIYSTPGNYAITITLRDTDGGTVSISGALEILPAVRLLIHEVRQGTPNVYKGLQGRGWGSIDDVDPATIRTAVRGNYDWEIKYAPSQTGTTLAADPQRGTIGTNEFDSFFHVWIGDTLAAASAAVPVAGETAMVRLNNEAQEVSGVFSREFYDSDGCGDIDHDELPDLWEIEYGLNCEDPGGVNGRMGNPDADFFPRGAGTTLAYPADKNNYTPDGVAFGNVFEVRGLGRGLNANTSSMPLGFADGDADEPRYGTYGGAPGFAFTEDDSRAIYGTDPTNPDTDNDGRDDGWEYYFWYNAKFRGITGERYDPSQVIAGTIIPSEEIVFAFDPLHPGNDKLDTDGDGLSDIEEFVLGTNPIHWDTDGDGMNDGWEVANGLDPFAPEDAVGNPDGDWMARAGDLRHWEVYAAFGFDPRTAWFEFYLDKDRAVQRGTPNTAPFTNYEEHYLGRAAIDAGFTAAVPPGGGGWMTNPQRADSDGDGMPDGWELYVSLGPVSTTPLIWPIGEGSELDAIADIDGDGLTARQEFHAIETCAPYGFANVNERWWNKLWATDPHNPDTDGDAVTDGAEGSVFRYDNGYTEYIRGCRPGGGLNPCSVDTDMDYLPDGWEFQFAGATTATGVEGGMDGTYFDSKSGADAITGEPRNFDYDGDGLENYQEYWANAVYHFQYDKWTAGLGYGGYDPADFFVGVPFEWDWAARANYWQGGESPDVPYFFMLPELRPVGFYGFISYASTDPSDPDSDDDGMDDFYEMFHGLNPLLSILVDIVGKTPGIVNQPLASYDFRIHPWLAGVENADPDMDGVPNWEEALNPNRPAPVNHHTDPSPLWFTDTSYANSFVNLYYNLGSMPMYWAEGGTFPTPSIMVLDRPYYMYDFEVNEGYDTDNDNIMDKQEILGTSVAGVTDPLDMESPLLRKALYLDGAAAARTRIGFAHGPNSLRSWTLEVWVRPEVPAKGVRQVILERPVWVLENDTMPGEGYVRRTFRLGLEWDGTPFVEYENSGKSGQTEKPRATGAPLQANVWRHLAATMSGVDKKLRLFIDGEMAGVVNAYAIPATGFIDGVMNNSSFTFIYSGAPLVIGAADANPLGSVDGGLKYINNSVYSGPSQPDLSSYFNGWVDEVRVWDGARTQEEIVADFSARKRYMRSDVIASREGSVARLNAILESRDLVVTNFGKTFDEFYDDAIDVILRTGGETAQSRLPPTLLYHYSFDNLPDPDFEPVVPASFASLNGRPTIDYPGIPWWHQAADRSTVYRTYDANPYLFVHWIENTVASLPMGRLDSNGMFRAEQSIDSKYWKRFSTGNDALDSGFENVFPNSANPYGMVYRHGDSAATQVDIDDVNFRFDPVTDGQFNHLLPLRGAKADKNVALWDNAASPGYDEFFDTDGDGMPDWWEIANGLDPFDPSDADIDTDGDGLSNKFEYLAGTDPNAIDSDHDGIVDLWEDPDGDGLSNYQEMLKGSHPLLPDTDDNGIWDDDDKAPALSLDPLVDRVLSLSGGYVEMPLQKRFALTNWTVQAWVKPAMAGANATVLARQVASNMVNYCLDLSNGVPRVRFTHQDRVASVVLAGTGALPTNTWTHLAGSFDTVNHRMSLFVNGICVAVKTTSRNPIINGLGPVYTRVGEGFTGLIDEVAILSAELDESDIVQLMKGVAYFAYDYPVVAYYRFDDGTSAVGPDVDGRHYGTSGRSDWSAGQVEEFASGFEEDWLRRWQNGGTLFGNAFMAAAGEPGIDSPVNFASGELYTDYDYTEDWWERLHDSIYTSTALYDSHLDNDGDGWDNWSEARYSAKSGITSAPDAAESTPAPDVTFSFAYTGAHREGPLTVMAYSSATMNGVPDATFVLGLPKPNATVVSTNEATLGLLHQGANWLFGFIDRNNSGAWDEGEPAGLATRFPYYVGWDNNNISFTLTDRPVNGFLRLSWPADANKAGYIVSLQRRTFHLINNTNTAVYTTIYAKSIAAPRNWLHEGDILDTTAYHAQPPLGYGPGPGLDWGGIIDGPTPIPIGYVSTYRLVVDGQVIEPIREINYIPDNQTLPMPELVSPVNGGVQIRPRPVFSWRMSPTASSFELQIAPTNSATPVYSSGLVAAPALRDATGLRTWSPPIHWGDIIPGGILTNRAYRWRVRVFQPRDPNNTQSAYSPYGYLKVNLSDSVQLGRIEVVLNANYLPPGATIRVQAFDSASFNDVPLAQKTITGVGSLPRTVVLEGLEKGKVHYIAAYVDQNNNNSRDIWESWGYYRAGNMVPGTWYYQPLPLLPAHAPLTPVANVKILHVDSDQDMIPDAYEYAMTGNLNSMGLALGEYGAMSAPGALAWTDLDGDGLDDYHEFFAGSDATTGDTSGDGISDRQALELGFSPAVVNELRITGFDSVSAMLGWTWAVPADAPVANVGHYGITPYSEEVPQRLNRPVTYVLYRTESLSNPQWQEVERFTTDSTSGAACDVSNDISSGEYPAAFYTIRAIIE